MKRIFSFPPWLAFLALPLFFISCKKDKASAGKSEKYQIVAGSWKQTDIVLGVDVSVKVGGNQYDFPAGTSMITDPYLNAFGVSSFFLAAASSSCAGAPSHPNKMCFKNFQRPWFLQN